MDSTKVIPVDLKEKRKQAGLTQSELAERLGVERETIVRAENDSVSFPLAIEYLDYWTPCSIITKNTMLLRDIDLLSELGRGPGCKVFLSITTLDKALAQRLEPDTPPPEKRLAALSRLVEAGIHAGVMVAPILPGLTDGPQLERLVDEAFRRGARFVQWGVLRLDEGVKEVFYSFLEDFAPRLLPMYGRMYPGVYAPEEYAHRIDSRLTKLEPPRRNESGRRGDAVERRPAATALPASPATSKPPLQLHLQL